MGGDNPVKMPTMLKLCGAILGISLGASGIILAQQTRNNSINDIAHERFLANGVLCKTKIENIEKDVDEIKGDIRDINSKVDRGFKEVLRKLR